MTSRVTLNPSRPFRRFYPGLQRRIRALQHSVRKSPKSLVEWVVVLGLFVSIWQGRSANQRADLSIELASRPFVSIERPYWWYEEDGNHSFWLGLGFNRRNYGERPAEELEFRNVRAVTIDIDEEGIANKVKHRTPLGSPYASEYLRDERNRLILHVMGVMSEYFRNHSDVSKVELEAFLDALSPQSPALQNDAIFMNDGALLFKRVEVNNEMTEYLQRQRTVVFPGQLQGRVLNFQMGANPAQILEGKNLLVVFLGLRYQGPLRNTRYSSFFLGYSDGHFSQLERIQQGRGGAFLREFQSWLSQEGRRKDQPWWRKWLSESSRFACRLGCM